MLEYRAERMDCSCCFGLKILDKAAPLFSSDLKISCCTAVRKQDNIPYWRTGRMINLAVCIQGCYNPTQFSCLRPSKDLSFYSTIQSIENDKNLVLFFSASKREDSLRRLEISVNDLVQVKVVHAAGNAWGPVHQHPGGHFPPCPQHLIQLTLCTVLHDDAVARCLSAYAPRLEKTQKMCLRNSSWKCQTRCLWTMGKTLGTSLELFQVK